MSDIQWTDRTDNPIRILKPDGRLGGHWCQKISEGCLHCYSEAINNNSYFNFASHLKYIGEPPALTLDTKLLYQWAGAKTEKKVFVGSMTDIFGDWVPREWHFQIFDAAMKSKLTFQFLTKRPEIMLQACSDWLQAKGKDELPPNFWMGCTVESQEVVRSRLPYLTQIPASVIFVSCEPLLEEVHLDCYSNDILDESGESVGYELFINYIDQVIIGGESGLGSRRCELEWMRSLLKQCRVAANEPAVFVKQMGSVWASHHRAKDRKGGNPGEWDADLRVREFPEVWGD